MTDHESSAKHQLGSLEITATPEVEFLGAHATEGGRRIEFSAQKSTTILIQDAETGAVTEWRLEVVEKHPLETAEDERNAQHRERWGIRYYPYSGKCERCGEAIPGRDVEFGADPYNLEIGGDDTPLWQCSECAYQSARDI
jgi:hypothetical protein